MKSTGKAKNTTSQELISMERKSALSGSRSSERVDMGILSDRFGYNLRRTHSAVLNHLEKSFEPLGIRPRQYGILTIVGRNPGLNQGQVSEALAIARTNFVGMLDTMEKRGLVKRKPAENDRRSYALYLTPKGAALLEKLSQIDAEHEIKMRSLIGEKDASQLLALLMKLRNAMLNDPM